MTTQKQATANKANAQKSTGAKTPEGKAVVAGNAVKHGILSTRILLAGESADLFNQLRDDMDKALKPVGILELVLSEKIAAAIWKQRRLIEAETASIELCRDMRVRKNQHQVDAVLGGLSNITIDDLALQTEDDRDQIQWCASVLAEFEALDDAVLEANDLAELGKAAPLIAGQFHKEAKEESETPSDYLIILGNNDRDLEMWVRDLEEWCAKEIARYERRPIIQAVANLVQSKQSAPIELELLARYQVALDGELYRAMDQLRKQQEWRIKCGIEAECEVVG